MKRLFVLLLLLFSIPSFAQIWEGNGGHLIEEDKTDESYLPYDSILEGIGNNTPPSPPGPTAKIYGYRILQSNNNDIDIINFFISFLKI